MLSYSPQTALKIKKLNFGCSVSFDREQYKCDPQMNNTRGLKENQLWDALTVTDLKIKK